MDPVIVNVLTVANSVLIVAGLIIIFFNFRLTKKTDKAFIEFKESIIESIRSPLIEYKQQMDELFGKSLTEMSEIKQAFKTETEDVVSGLKKQASQSFQELSKECKRTLDRLADDTLTIKNNFEQETSIVRNNFNQESVKITSSFKELRNDVVQWLNNFKVETDQKYELISNAQSSFNKKFNDSVVQLLNDFKFESDQKYTQTTNAQNIFNNNFSETVSKNYNQLRLLQVEFIKDCTDKLDKHLNTTDSFKINALEFYKELQSNIILYQETTTKLINERFDELKKEILSPLSFDE